jgi:large subunit ribosomal protein L21
LATDAGVKIGKPAVSGVTVTAKFLNDLRGEKIRVSKFKSKVRYRRVTGFRAALTKIQIEKISEAVKTAAKKS